MKLKGKVYTLDEAILLLERQQANTKIDQIGRASASLKLISPASGIVAYNNPEFFFGGFSIQPGRTVWIGQSLFNLVNPDKMEAKCFVLEKDAGELKTDQPVTVTLDPFPGQEFTGKVKTIDNLARPIDQGSPVKYFQVIVSLDKTDPKLMKPGVKLKAQIRASELKSVIVVPRSAVVKKRFRLRRLRPQIARNVRACEGQTRTGRPDPGGRDRRASSRTDAGAQSPRRETRIEG